MENSLDTVPPVVRLIASEPLAFECFSDATKFFHKILPELRSQAEWSVSNFNYTSKNNSAFTTDFISTPVSGLNPFSYHGKCHSLNCRVENAKRFAQTLGLYSDQIILPDPFTGNFLDESDNWSSTEIEEFLIEALVLKQLMPLIESGVIHFQSPLQHYCSPCFEKMSGEIHDLAEAVIKEFSEEIQINFRTDLHGYSIKTGHLYDPPITRLIKGRRVKKENISKRANSLLVNSIADEIQEILLSIQNENSPSSAIFSNSRVTLKALQKIEGKKFSLPELDIWENAHSAKLPWIKDLSVEQVVQLRQQAGRALPQLRETLARSIGPRSNEVPVSFNDSSIELVRELRAGAEEVAAELSAINLKQEKNFHNVAGLLGLTISVYGFGADFLTPGIALGSLLTTLGLIHTVTKKDQQDVNKIVSKPGYVLVKAKELLRHAENVHA